MDLDANYRITGDKRQFILQKKRKVTNKETGEVTEKWGEELYYGDLNRLTKAIIHEVAAESLTAAETYEKFLDLFTDALALLNVEVRAKMEAVPVT